MTNIRRYGWRGVVCASLLLIAGICGAASGDSRFFRIGTAATGGSFFEIGGVIAGAISGPIEGPACGYGGSCGVRGLVAVAQATPGSVDNLRLINAGQIESGFAQSDLAGWAYWGVEDFAGTGPQRGLRAIASLFPEAAQLVVRADSPIRSLADLAGKRVSLGEVGSGSAVDARVLLAAAGLGDKDLTRRYLRPGPAAEELKEGTLDAFFLVGGYPTPAIRDVASKIPIRLVPIGSDVMSRLQNQFRFYHSAVIKAGTYPGVDVDTPSLGFYALWLVNADVDADLVYEITRSLWNKASAKLFAGFDPVGTRIRLDDALTGVSVPLHPGAERYYRENGMPVDSAPQLAAQPAAPANP